MDHTRKWRPVCPKLRRVQEKAKANPGERSTSLARHITAEALRRAYRRLDGAAAAAGVDGVTKNAYGKELERDLTQLHESLKRGAYRAGPVRRRWTEKPDGGKRPPGIPTVEDKVVQGAVDEILNCIYEEDFLGFSYGLRPGRSAHQALRALQTVLQKGRVNRVPDVDISRFFDMIDHKEPMSMLSRRVVDRSLPRLIGKWLAAGVVEENGRRIRDKKGTPQGGVTDQLVFMVTLKPCKSFN